jgi:hypothetical protein
MNHLLAILLLSAGSGLTVAAESPASHSPELACTDLQRAQDHARAFLALVDSGLFEAAWESGTSHYRSQQKKEEWLKMAKVMLQPASKPTRRDLLAFRQAQAAAPHEASRVATFDYFITQADGSRHTERLTVGALPAEECGVVRYQVDVRRMALTRILDGFIGNLNKAGGRLDYSTDSLIEIERVLMEHAPGGEPRAKQTKGADYRAFVHFLGQYVGEVLVRHHGGQWSNTPSPMNKVPPLILMPGGRRIDPYQMVADYARQPAIGTLRQSLERELAASAPRS